MPKITQKKTVKNPEPPADSRPPEWVDRYAYVGFPGSLGASKLDAVRLRNLQICTCGHDRTIHSDMLGRGERQVMVVDCPNAGRCVVSGCECEGFVFAEESPPEGHKKRAEEAKVAGVVPPGEDEV